MVNKKNDISSVAIGIILGALIGYYIGITINRILFSFDSMTSIITISIISIIGAVIGGINGFKRPVITEIFAFAFSIFLILQFIWDFGANDLNTFRWVMFTSAIILLIINIFTGKVKRKGGGRIAKRAFGL